MGAASARGQGGANQNTVSSLTCQFGVATRGGLHQQVCQKPPMATPTTLDNEASQLMRPRFPAF
eukprot:CAMPEP_0119469768 /NCGR_PEP_ID=MMETSP1344-20130328/2952_1 /TAXON_ID=236787 /ORGANISM="Florenciella parvula, Strain CCMP2471" /LENGTH=63 /DNA_ID=CAMNT_0007502361 /DNA_START=385 /DNA_END=576 /DNA_ORIENTATION=-